MTTTKIRTYDDKVCTNFQDLNVPENGIEQEILSASIFRQLGW